VTDAHVLSALGFDVSPTEGGRRGVAEIVPHMHAPGTRAVRTSILATWVDVVAGHLALDTIVPKVPVTLSLDVHVADPRRECRAVQADATVVKQGRSIVVARVDIVDEQRRPVALGWATMMASPVPGLEFDPERAHKDAPHVPNRRLEVPFTEHVHCTREERGVASVPLLPNAVNASYTLQGGLIGLAAEEAALSLFDDGEVAVSSMVLRYLRPVRTGPAVGTATRVGSLCDVTVRDRGEDDRVALTATIGLAFR
jgi:acyl-coenzyme A thioesterase PaaI-like protein